MATTISNTSTTPFNAGLGVTSGTQYFNSPAQPSQSNSNSPYAGSSIVDYLNSQGKASDFNTRSTLASQKGISNYTGTADQNTQLLNILRGTSSTTPQPTLQPTSTPSTSSLTPQSSSTSQSITGLVSPQAPTALSTSTSTPTSQAPTTTPAAFTPVVQGLVNVGTQGSDAYNKAVQDLQTLKTNLAQQTANIETAGTDLPLQTGQEAALNRLAASKIQAGQEAVQQQQTQQQQQIGALQGAGNLLQPQANYPFVFNPSTQTFNNAGGGSVLSVQQAAQMALNGQYNQALSGLSYMGSSAEGQLQSAIQQLNPNANVAQLKGQSAATQTNAQTAGTAQTNIAASGLQTATQNYVNANTAYQTAQNQSSNLQQILQTTGINQSAQFINQPINSLANQLGSANFTSFITALTELQQKYTNLLSTIGAQTPTVNGQQATLILNPNSTPAQINAAIDALNNAAYAQLKPLYEQISTYQGQLSGNQTSNASTASPWH